MTSKSGFQVFPEFVVTQGAKSLTTLERLHSFFERGKIYENRRADNHRENLHRYCVRSINDIRSKIIPFFEQYELQTAKQQDFLAFCEIVRLMKDRSHLTDDGLQAIRELAAATNRRKLRV